MEWIAAIYNTVVDFFTGWIILVQNIWGKFWMLITEPHMFFNWAWTFLMDFIYEACNTIIGWIGQAVTWAIGLMPDFLQDIVPQTTSIPERWLQALNWLIPFEHLSAAIAILIVSTMTWASFGIVFRWLKIFS